MKCLSDETLSSYIDRVLDNREQQAVEAHLQECWHCRRAFGDYRTITQKISRLPDLEVPKDFRQNLMGKLDRPKKRVYPPKGTGVAAAVLIAALAVPGFWFFNQPKSYKQISSAADQVQSKQAAPQAAAPQEAASLGDKAVLPVQSKGVTAGGVPSADTTSGADRNLSLQLRVVDVQASSQAVVKQVSEISGAELAYLNTIAQDTIKLQAIIPGPDSQAFLAGLAKVGSVVAGNFTGNIAETNGNNTVTILIIKQK